MKKITNSAGGEYVRVYENMGGIGSAKDSPEKRYCYTENMYRDRYSDDGAIESIPGFRRLYSFEGKINAIHKWTLGDGKEFIFVHAEDKLYRFEKDGYDSLSDIGPITTLKDTKSSAVAFERSLYILDGEKITVVDEYGNVKQITRDGGENLYTPLCYTDRQPHEDRNMLTSDFTESYLVSSASDIRYGTPEIIYSVTDDENKCCAVVGIKSGHAPDVYIPSFTKIGKEIYKVSTIAPMSFFYNLNIKSVTMSEGLEHVGSFCFWGCTSLEKVVLSNTVRTVEDSAFYKCSALQELYIGLGLQKISISALHSCSSLAEINYAGNENMLTLINGATLLLTFPVNYEAKHDEVVVMLPVLSEAKEIKSVTVNGAEASFEFRSNEGGVIITLGNKKEIEGAKVLISGTLKDGADSIGCIGGERISSLEALIGCTVCEVFDGRLFLSGNPQTPGMVFYSHVMADGTAIPLYFAKSARFSDGSGDFNVLSLVSNGENLVVFKSGDDGSGSIFYHKADGPREKRTYPLTYVHGKLTAKGGAYLFLNEAVFLSELGLTRLKRSGTDYKTPISESMPINRLLLKESTENIRFCEWLGYLVLSVGDRIYLADASERMHSGKDTEYEWYYLKGIGSYKNDTRVYRYADFTKRGYHLAEHPGEVVREVVHSTTDEDGSVYYYVSINRRMSLVIPTDEYSGGDFYPVSAIASSGELLFFGTECGDLCVFNNDKRGLFPDGSYEENDAKGRLHKSYYSFLGHAVRYALKTYPDELEVGYFEKSTVGASLIIRHKNLDGGSLKCEIITDKGAKRFEACPLRALSFDDTDFGELSTAVSDKSYLTVNDRSRGFFEKQIALYSDSYASPFGVYSISYRYKIEDTVKKSTI
ncbi:MAG: leucine-rich repeat domain-containing protein [Clostridia bacterium]|nr:leucine-rich repeat domain-containing protein [Clostridia bacterium]